MSPFTGRLGPVRQNGYVVTDMDSALHHWTTVLGVGPWYLIDRVNLDWFACRDSDAKPDLCIALANSGDLQIELICQRDDTPSTYLDFLKSGEDGLQHLAFWSQHYQDDLDALLANGLPIAQAGQIGGPQGRFAYFDTSGHRGTMLELSDISGSKGAFFAHIRDAAANWDGSRPVRSAS